MADENTWVLDLSTDPPDIYNSAVSEHAHNALDIPFPSAFWYVNQAGNDISHSGETTYHSPCFTSPFPSVFWYVNQSGNDVVHDNSYDYTPMGAFRKSGLSQIKITPTTELLGEYSFAQTLLTEVTISSNCVYYPTTFPSTCEVSFYEEV